MWVYIIRNTKGTLYTGITSNIIRRLRQHNGEIVGGAKATRVGRPWILFYAEAAEDRSSAAIREACVKKLTKRGKIVLAKRVQDEAALDCIC